MGESEEKREGRRRREVSAMEEKDPPEISEESPGLPSLEGETVNYVSGT